MEEVTNDGPTSIIEYRFLCIDTNLVATSEEETVSIYPKKVSIIQRFHAVS